MPESPTTLSLMGQFATPAPLDVVGRVQATSSVQLSRTLAELQLARGDVREVVSHWDDFRRD